MTTPDFTVLSEPDSPVQDAPIPVRSPDPVQEVPMPLNEFCLHFNTQAEVETMGAFRFLERAAGRLVDVPSAYSARLAALHAEQH